MSLIIIILIIIICFGWCGLSVSVSVHDPCSFKSNICLSVTMQMRCGGNDDHVQEPHHSQVNYCKIGISFQQTAINSIHQMSPSLLLYPDGSLAS